MRSKYDQEIGRCILRYGPEQAGDRGLFYVGPYHKINDDRERQKVYGVIRTGTPEMKSERGPVPYARDMAVNTIFKESSPTKLHSI